jgi:SAM-dependent methyltransferase
MTAQFDAKPQLVPGYEARVFPDEILRLLRCPVSGERLIFQGGELVTSSDRNHYRIDDSGIALFAEQFCSADARAQEQHYDSVSSAYIENLGYPHTQEYLAYLDRVLTEVVEAEPIGVAAEVCCGAGEAFQLYQDKLACGIGMDISTQMLSAAKRKFSGKRLYFLQGDATMMPLESGVFDTVFMLGGIHHVNDRHKLFSEINRILKPGGRFIWREPVSDFWLWRLLRAVIYRASPMLDHATERPLLYRETVPVLQSVGMVTETWRTVGFLGFCLFMNSDVLYFNRFFRFVPSIRAITRAFIALDDLICRLPGLRMAGLIVVGSAQKPK